MARSHAARRPAACVCRLQARAQPVDDRSVRVSARRPAARPTGSEPRAAAAANESQGTALPSGAAWPVGSGRLLASDLMVVPVPRPLVHSFADGDGQAEQ